MVLGFVSVAFNILADIVVALRPAASEQARLRVWA
jgi:hypothetical protein